MGATNNGPEDTAAQSEPSILVLSLERGNGSTTLETHFIQELKLILEGVQLKVIDLGDGEFIYRNIVHQNERLRPLMKEHNAVSVLWIYQPSPKRVALQMSAMSDGRGLARIVELPNSGGIETDLAMAAKELIEIAFSFHPRETENPISSGPVDTPPNDGTTDKSERALTIGGTYEFGIYGDKGPSSMLGAFVEADWMMLKWLGVRIQYSIKGAPLGSLDGQNISGLTMDFGGGMFGRLDSNRWSFLPRFDIRARWSKREVVLEDASPQLHTAHGYSISGGLDIRFRFASRMGAQLGANMVWLPERQRFSRESNGEAIFATPFVSIDCRFSVFFLF